VSARRGALVALAVGLAVLLVGLGVALLTSKPRLAGTNNVRHPVFAAVVPPGAAVCQSGEGIPADADRVKVLVGTYGSRLPPVTLTALGKGGRLVARYPGGGPEGFMTIPVRRTKRAVEGLTICLQNEGARRIAIAGEAIPPPATIGKRPADGRFRLAWYRPGRENWLQLTGTVLHRFGYGNAPWFGGWLLVLVALMLLGAGAIAVSAVLREPDPPEGPSDGDEPDGARRPELETGR